MTSFAHRHKEACLAAWCSLLWVRKNFVSFPRTSKVRCRYSFSTIKHKACDQEHMPDMTLYAGDAQALCSWLYRQWQRMPWSLSVWGSVRQFLSSRRGIATSIFIIIANDHCVDHMGAFRMMVVFPGALSKKWIDNYEFSSDVNRSTSGCPKCLQMSRKVPWEVFSRNKVIFSSNPFSVLFVIFIILVKAVVRLRCSLIYVLFKSEQRDVYVDVVFSYLARLLSLSFDCSTHHKMTCSGWDTTIC